MQHIQKMSQSSTNKLRSFTIYDVDVDADWMRGGQTSCSCIFNIYGRLVRCNVSTHRASRVLGYNGNGDPHNTAIYGEIEIQMYDRYPSRSRSPFVHTEITNARPPGESPRKIVELR